MTGSFSSRSHWWVYLIRTSGNALYCGITTNTQRRFQQHQRGQGAKALRGKGPLTLVWQYAVGSDKSQALKLEYRIKRLSKEKKESLVAGTSALSEFPWGAIVSSHLPSETRLPHDSDSC
ncbi:GIY-YIG nuclease family protein [Vibrio cincinnatiensis]|jgi:putative endonuclease|uniref:Putative endonuclease n=1 Tax=Vibrio cincinnatiensis DSM 19608 TaxID=1123491 RepID=A0A1T4S1E4_VIBCI|nr:GIY-YIG nuclease family protein [Vibrio cincinnatiensis]MCG3723155.1 GIY-YIG nuclease family protein [Vibrio cincinnatiensis]MCG3726187.1 GIY-YIG nuclease family protein [Vibrio cincinnatiensis]MCG3733780.1 GIY-YIG nuclease family protein [Vibrio cincinnatiensis]MCG3740964.1 GIY-YIG nuclease family protein [Vibrio cincinnatiensis]MCG3744560.1 GIY-YIG nuclease family protein [Vibrio cincinnatiensis]